MHKYVLAMVVLIGLGLVGIRDSASHARADAIPTATVAPYPQAPPTAWPCPQYGPGTLCTNVSTGPVQPTATGAPTTQVVAQPTATVTPNPCYCPASAIACSCPSIPAPGAITATSTPQPTNTPVPTATPRPLVWRILRAQLVRAKPDGHSRTGPLVRFGQVVVLKGRPVHGWQYIVAGHVRGWVLARNLYHT